MTLALEGVEFGYARRAPILRGVDARFEPGRIAAILGPNGAGKSTLLRVALGVAKPWSGRVTLDGAPVRTMRPARRAACMALVPQRPDVAGAFTVRQMLALGRHALPRNDGACERAAEALDLADLLDRPFARLSVGQQQRVALARAMAQLDALSGRDLRGAALLADEPFSAMDPRYAVLAADALRAAASHGCAVVVVLHDATSALRFADDALLLDSDGRVAASGPAREVITPESLGALFDARFESVGPLAVLPVSGPEAAPADTLSSG